jgi:hypothetical protein
MRAKLWIAPFALTTSLILAGTAFAQMQIGDQVYTDDEVGLIQEHCDELHAVRVMQVNSDSNSVRTIEEAVGVQFGDEPLHPGTAIDFDRISYNDCISAGF